MTFTQALSDHLDCFEKLRKINDAITAAAHLISKTLAQGGKILICGNGGSAADSQHFAAEIVGRFAREREAWPAIALTTDTSILTAVANDYAFDAVFARQVEGLGGSGDVLIGLSTSGNSENVLRAAVSAHQKSMKVIALLGNRGGKMAALADIALRVPANQTPRIQELHAFILHVWAETIEEILISGKDAS
jgi:D-sedoheptulose 7-phosphate isomerase